MKLHSWPLQGIDPNVIIFVNRFAFQWTRMIQLGTDQRHISKSPLNVHEIVSLKCKMWFIIRIPNLHLGLCIWLKYLQTSHVFSITAEGVGGPVVRYWSEPILFNQTIWFPISTRPLPLAGRGEEDPRGNQIIGSPDMSRLAADSSQQPRGTEQCKCTINRA